MISKVFFFFHFLKSFNRKTNKQTNKTNKKNPKQESILKGKAIDKLRALTLALDRYGFKLCSASY